MFLGRWYRRFKAIRQTTLKEDGLINLSSDLDIFIGKNAQIIANALVRIGYPLPGMMPAPSKNKSVIILGKNSKLIFNGPVFIESGANIRIADNACLTFGGDNYISRDLTLLCAKEIIIGQGTSISWNATLIDDDNHHYKFTNGRKIKGTYHPLIIGKNVGIQLNVTIPKGVTIGDNSIVSAETVLRQDVTANSLVYSKSSLEIKHGYSTDY